jgi:hypothetical protein
MHLNPWICKSVNFGVWAFEVVQWRCCAGNGVAGGRALPRPQHVNFKTARHLVLVLQSRHELHNQDEGKLVNSHLARPPSVAHS